MEPEPHQQYLQFAPCKLIRILDQGSGEVFFCEIWNPENFCWYNPESWALESRILLKESKILPAIGIWIQVPLNEESRIQNPGSSIRNPQRGIHKPRLSWITLHQWKQYSFGTSNISPQFNSPAANHSSFIPYKLVITIYMPKGQGSIYLVLSAVKNV